jgi:hypothetical protein
MTNIVQPYRPLSPENCTELAEALEQAIVHLTTQGIAISPSSRLPKAVKQLRAVAVQKTYPDTPAELRAVMNSIKAAFDFHAIAQALPTIPNNEVHDTCRRAVGGLLADEGPTDAHRAQTQLQFGCVLAEAGLRPAAVQPTRRKVPDYLIALDGLPTAMEVKRPASATGVKANVEAGIGQCRDFGTPLNALALDLSDCVGIPSAIFQGSSSQAEAEGQRRFRKAYLRASEYIIGRKADAGFSRCGALFAFAGAAFWPSEQPRKPLSRLLFYAEVFHHATSGLLLEQCRRLRERVVDGFRALGASLPAIPRA